jgi:hypothetical protein
MSRTNLLSAVLCLASLFSAPICCVAEEASLREQALQSARKATEFLSEQVSTRGGYLWAYSADLELREGEGVVETDTVWVQPPGTPAVGEAFVKLYEATGDRTFLNAAGKAGEALRLGQMRSGGWKAMVEFEPERRRKWAYRTDPPRKKSKDQSSLDDDKTQSALRFLIHLDRALKFRDETVHEMTSYGLDKLITQAQFANGGFPQVWTDERLPGADLPARQASYPESWSRTYQGHKQYWHRYTLNDNLAHDVVRTLLLADDVYGDTRYRDAALRLGDSLLVAQMPDPQPAWAQQYSFQMQPIWARKFEPPAITSSESFSVLSTLMLLYAETGDPKYLRPIPRALDYLETCELPDGQVARFYELKTNRPLYFNRKYELTYRDDDLPTHYGFKLNSRVDSLRRAYQKLVQMNESELQTYSDSRSTASEARVQAIIENQDDRGAWVTEEPLRYHKHPGPSISMRLTVGNLNTLANYLHQTNP